MHILFMDESGTPPKPEAKTPSYFVAGGIMVPIAVWPALRDGLNGLKIRLRIRGEIKWRYFAPANNDESNPMRRLEMDERNEVRRELYKLICSHRSVRTIGSIVSCDAAYAMPSINAPQDIYSLAYKGLTERFQYHLQDLSRDLGSKQFGIVVADHRGRDDDTILRQVHQKLLHSKGEFISTYDNFVEGLFLTPSHLSVGIQLADIVAGAFWRRFERADDTWFNHLEPSLRRSGAGVIEGYGLVKLPKATWK